MWKVNIILKSSEQKEADLSNNYEEIVQMTFLVKKLGRFYENYLVYFIKQSSPIYCKQVKLLITIEY